ncbi:MAG TPA: DUF1684 domain-containing protein [Candidatus Sulfopaludibacter sp.]|jgi:hypothetical protein|nr:DUF1684 domain-containing protein [Candidatus Sulfopaludibacter sp.]
MRVAALLIAMSLSAASTYQSEIAEWRRNREAVLKAEGGWLSVAGLFWLHDGANSFGTASNNEIVLPDGAAHAGTFELHEGKVSTGSPKRELKADDSKDVLQVGRLSLFVIKRGVKYGIRLKDPGSEYRRNFHGIQYFPANEAYRVTARFVAEPKKIPILNVLGQTEDSECPGYAVFQLNGHEFRLYPIIEEPGAQQLFYIFKDQTAGKETYGAGRFLYSDMPKDGKVVLDFNKAYNPPCCFTPYATCPLPPPENRMAVRVEAGEKKYDH